MVVLCCNVAIDELLEIIAGNSSIRARPTVIYMKHGKVHLMVSGGYVVVIMNDIKNHGDQLCPLLYRKETASVMWDMESCACSLNHFLVRSRIEW